MKTKTRMVDERMTREQRRERTLQILREQAKRYEEKGWHDLASMWREWIVEVQASAA